MKAANINQLPLTDYRRIETLDALRGLAALSVCWFHFTNGNPLFGGNGILAASGKYGWMGVNVFFVISGFVIPYALHKSDYRLPNYFRFVLKRVIRLDPPYLVAILITVVLGYLSERVHASDYQLTVAQLLLHLGYLNAFFGYEWLSPVFWTLAIEFQFYILIGLLFPLLKSSGGVRLATLSVLGLLAFLPYPNLLFHYLFCFLLGIVTFQFWIGVIKQREYVMLLAVLSVGCWFTLGIVVAFISLCAAAIIAYVTITNRILLFFGMISYSLYLLHVIVGGKIINLSLRFSFNKPVVLLTAIASTTGAAYLLYRFVERPSQAWSSAVKYDSAPFRAPKRSFPIASVEYLAAVAAPDSVTPSHRTDKQPLC